MVAGAAVGACLGLLGALRASRELGVNPEARAILVPAVAGAIAGGVLYLLRGARNTGVLGYYLAWALACAVGVVAVVLPGAIREERLVDLIGAALLGGGMGLGLGLFVRQLAGSRW
jgi:hypothetical protein